MTLYIPCLFRSQDPHATHAQVTRAGLGAVYKRYTPDLTIAATYTEARMKSTVLVYLAGRNDEITEFVPIFHAV